MKLRLLFIAIPLGTRVLLSTLCGGIAGLGGFTFHYAAGWSYLSDDPKACANCHVMREVYDEWNRGPHHAVAVCNDCHTPHSSLIAKYGVKGRNGFRHSEAFTRNRIPDPIRITDYDRKIVQENCLTCHGEVVSGVAHTDKKNPTDCLTCHAGVGHGY